MILSLIISLLLTILIELSISTFLGIKTRNDIRIVILVNICTNPIVVYIANILKLLNYKLYLCHYKRNRNMKKVQYF